MNEIRLPYGLQGSKLRHISDVASGLACKCFCPCCGSALVARKGKRVQHHFSHYDSTTCSGSTETALHLAAKEILEEAMAITLPSVNIEFDMYQRGLEISPSRRFNIDKIQIETRAGSIVPDLIATVGDRQLIIEIFVTHRVDVEKINRIRKQGVSAIEIDLSGAPRDFSRESITDLVVDEHLNKIWLFNAVAEFHHKKILASSTRKRILERGGLRVDNCPIRPKAQPYADVIRECAYCDHCVEIGSDQDYIQCSPIPIRRTSGT